MPSQPSINPMLESGLHPLDILLTAYSRECPVVLFHFLEHPGVVFAQLVRVIHDLNLFEFQPQENFFVYWIDPRESR